MIINNYQVIDPAPVPRANLRGAPALGSPGEQKLVKPAERREGILIPVEQGSSSPFFFVFLMGI